MDTRDQHPERQTTSISASMPTLATASTEAITVSTQAITRANRWPRILTLLSMSTMAGSALLSMLGTSGCALVAGIEKREDDGSNSQFDTVDSETQLPTTDLCVSYCDEVSTNCVEEYQVYKTRIACINTCNALPEGDDAEPIGNSVQCRLDRAKAAVSAADEQCAAAGPSGGDGVCGTACEAWCLLLESECPDSFAALADCENACTTIPTSGGFNVEENYEADTLECRLIHLGAVGAEKQASIHCGHGSYIANERCIAPADEVPDCAYYCDVNMINCAGDAVYDSRDECLATCEALPPGNYTDTIENTVGCRIYHSKNAEGAPAKHCPHGSPSGDGHCGVYDDAETGYTGNCESYCYLYQAACASEFDEDGFQDIEDCAKTCTTELRDDGAKNDRGYLVSDAASSDTVQCRVYTATKILGGEDISCEKVRLSGKCD